MKRFVITISESLHTDLKVIAALAGTSMNWTILHILLSGSREQEKIAAQIKADINMDQPKEKGGEK